MEQVPIYTIGYGNRTVEEFLQLLQRYKIAFLIDIRSAPYSRHSPQFSKDTLKTHLQQYNIQYVFMGDTLGGRPTDKTCYLNDKVDYAILSTKNFYQQGIERLRTAWEKQLHVVIMCAEAKPQECHRSKLIGNTLVERQIAVAHIDETGDLKEQNTINLLLTGNPTASQLSLFTESIIATDKKIGFSRKRHAASNEGA